MTEGSTQKEVAAQIGVNTWTYRLWERDETNPSFRYYPAILNFLDYDPFPSPKTTGERLTQKRRELGLSIKRAAKLVGVDESTFADWENGKTTPHPECHDLQAFIKEA